MTAVEVNRCCINLSIEFDFIIFSSVVSAWLTFGQKVNISCGLVVRYWEMCAGTGNVEGLIAVRH